MLTDRAIQLISNAKIESAVERGEFKDLPGFGKPFEFDEMSLDNNWWIKRKIELEQLSKYAVNKKKRVYK